MFHCHTRSRDDDYHTASILGGVLLLFLGYMVVRSLPEMRRYLRIERM